MDLKSTDDTFVLRQAVRRRRWFWGNDVILVPMFALLVAFRACLDDELAAGSMAGDATASRVHAWMTFGVCVLGAVTAVVVVREVVARMREGFWIARRVETRVGMLG